MGSRIQCFVLEPTDKVRLELRRYNGSEAAGCPDPVWKYHNANVLFTAPDGSDSWPLRMSGEHDGCTASYENEAPPHDDPRWPTKCDKCDYLFAEKDYWQVFQNRLYRRADTGELYTPRNAPPGAMYDAASWYPPSFGRGPDGRALIVCLPPGGGDDYWFVDGPSSNGNGWTRTGEWPNVTANPSILTRNYHGFLRAGWLEEC
jgi:hypothetical protein